MSHSPPKALQTSKQQAHALAQGLLENGPNVSNIKMRVLNQQHHANQAGIMHAINGHTDAGGSGGGVN